MFELFHVNHLVYVLQSPTLPSLAGHFEVWYYVLQVTTCFVQVSVDAPTVIVLYIHTVKYMLLLLC
jgi:hypothetical protein